MWPAGKGPERRVASGTFPRRSPQAPFFKVQLGGSIINKVLSQPIGPGSGVRARSLETLPGPGPGSGFALGSGKGLTQVKLAVIMGFIFTFKFVINTFERKSYTLSIIGCYFISKINTKIRA